MRERVLTKLACQGLRVGHSKIQCWPARTAPRSCRGCFSLGDWSYLPKPFSMDMPVRGHSSILACCLS